MNLLIKLKNQRMILSHNKVFLSNSMYGGIRFSSSNKLKPENEVRTSSTSTALYNKIDPYIKLGRFDKPIGWILLYLPCIWGLTASYPLFNLIFIKKSLLFLSGSIIMRSCGCAINDLCDKNFDKKVERTKDRPLASGKLNSYQAIGFIALHFLAGLWILTQFNTKCLLLGFAITPVFIVYPLMKRVTYLPQLILGVCFNSGVLIGFNSIYEFANTFEALPLYISGILWTLIYDTFYAHMDKKDDVKAGVKGSALYFNNSTKEMSYILYVIIFVLISYFISKDNKKRLSKLQAYLSLEKNEALKQRFKYLKALPYLSLALSIMYQVRLIKKTDLNSPAQCMKVFKKSSWFGVFVIISLLTNNQINNRLISSIN